MLLLAVLFLLLINYVITNQQIYNGSLNFNDHTIIILKYPFTNTGFGSDYGLVNNITYNVSVENNYQNMLVIKFPRFNNIVGANNLYGTLNHTGLTCDFVCSRGWTTSTMFYVDFYSYGPTNLTYLITVNYNVEAGTESFQPIFLIFGMMGALLLVFIIILIICVRKNQQESVEII